MDALGELRGVNQTDQQYVQECLNGHPEQYRYLAQRYEGVLLSHLIGKLHDRNEAEEAAQEALVRAYFWLPNLRSPSSFFSWLVGIADRVAHEQERSRRRDDKTAAAAAQRLAEQQPAASPDYPLQEAIACLPENQKQVVLLRYYADLSCKQIAEQLEMPLGTVTKLLSRAYLALREKLQGPGTKQRCAGRSEVSS
jgi:RNA polymerase sigma factor (sigma-70 family)